MYSALIISDGRASCEKCCVCGGGEESGVLFIEWRVVFVEREAG